ncbi:MAG: DUF2207 domain-containing protein, partial [Actinomycetota bacterium]
MTVLVESSGALEVGERITFAYVASFTGAYRDIPLREGESISEVQVLEDHRAFTSGGCTELGCSSPPGTFGVTNTGDGIRVVWHYSAANEQRTFELSYRIKGITVAYDDVVDVNIRLWGDEWDQRLGKLTATVTAQGPITRAWGHPVSVPGDVTIDGEQALFRALDVPPGTFVEGRVLFPRAYLPNPDDAVVRQRNALDRIVAEEVGAANDYERDRERIDKAVDHLPRTLLLLGLLGLIAALAFVYFVYRRYGRELDVGYDREYEQEPPTALEPALVPSLVAQRTRVGSNEFTATLFDLIRRGRYKAEGVTTERSVWGGLRHEEIADLELSQGEQLDLTPYEAE